MSSSPPKLETVAIENVYNPDFVEKIQKSEKEFEQGKSKKVAKEDLPKLLGL